VEITGREAMPGVHFGADSPKLIILAERRVQAPPAPPKKPDVEIKTDQIRIDVPPKQSEDGEPG
jgi:hypothetical protein